MHVRADPFFEEKRRGQAVIPCDQLAIRWTDGDSGYLQLSATDQLVATGNSSNRGREEVAFDIMFGAHLDDIAGEYSIELHFTFTNR